MHHKCGIAREHARSYYYYLAQTKQQHLCAQALQHGHGVSLVVLKQMGSPLCAVVLLKVSS